MIQDYCILYLGPYSILLTLYSLLFVPSLSRIFSIGFDHIRQGFQFVEQTAELGNVLYVHHDLGVDIIMLGLDIDIFQVDGFADQQVGDVINEPLTVIGFDRDGYGVDLFGLSPGDGNQTFRVADALDVGAVDFVDGAAPPDGDIADDVVARSRVAAFPEGGIDVSDAQNGDVGLRMLRTGPRNQHRRQV